MLRRVLSRRVTNEQYASSNITHAPLDKGLTRREFNRHIVACRLDLVVMKDLKHFFVRAVRAELRANRERVRPLFPVLTSSNARTSSCSFSRYMS